MLMIPLLSPVAPAALYRKFLDALSAMGFSGEIRADVASRTVLATDNSVYQLLPQAVVYPQHTQDLIYLTELAATATFKSIVVSPRGGGTGTNGQSLTQGILVDLSRHMNQILEIDVAERRVKVQAGVVKDQLNAALRPYGLFFAPELSTSNRATLGGMINTDASGQGSCLYGKTRDHVIELTTVLLDGSVLNSRALNDAEFNAACAQDNRIGLIHRLIHGIEQEFHQQIEDKFPKLNRCLTGYDLAHIRDDLGRFNLNNILCGSEGTLGFITEATLNVLPIPKVSCLWVVKYADFNGALRHAKTLMNAGPTSIETIDSKVLNLAMGDIVWHEVAEFFPGSDTPVLGINLVEFTGDDEATLRQIANQFGEHLAAEASAGVCIGATLAWGEASVNKLWGMRKKAVGLLGNTAGESRPVPFVEDTAVPPENLADFILEFRALLDSHGLQYGMFGHVDAGVLHVRPALDLKDPAQVRQLRDISDRVADLTHKHHGLLWGEHGKGVRSEYAPKFFGELYPQLQKIKAAFDPYNQLNPGKIATPSADLELLKIDGVTMRGELDRQIPVQVWQEYKEAVYCNGNGACYNWAANDPMCPSWKVTRDRVHSPKGRASLVREWLRQLTEHGVDPTALLAKPRAWWTELTQMPARLRNTKSPAADFSHEVHSAMMGCLACKSCVGQCPIKVDVPDFRSKFLALYYQRYQRPVKDYLVGSLEFVLPVMAKIPRIYNALMGATWVKSLLSRYIGFEDSPLLSGIVLERALAERQIALATPEVLNNLSADQKVTSLILVQDAFTSFFDTQVVIDCALLLQQLGFTPLLAPYQANGKPLHVHGFLQSFGKTAAKNAAMLTSLSQHQIPLVGIDPAMTLSFSGEYAKVLGAGSTPKVLLIQEFLSQHLPHLKSQASAFAPGHFKLLPHCTEKTNAPGATASWKTVFAALGQQLEIVSVGCCGMSGTYGHESSHRQTSKQLFDMSWRAPVMAFSQPQPVDTEKSLSHIVATGYSCRSQTKREAGRQLLHPLQGLLAGLLRSPGTNS